MRRLQLRNLRNAADESDSESSSMEAESDKSIEQLYAEAFEKQHRLEFGFNFEARDILIDNVRVRSEGKKQTIRPKPIDIM